MVDKFGDLSLLNFDQRLEAEWSKLAGEQKTKEVLENNMKRILEEGNLAVIYNKKTDITRLIEAEGTGDNLPRVEYGAGQQEEDKDIFEEQLEDALCVFKTGNNYELLEKNQDQILFYVDLENETIISKHQKDNNEGDLEEEVQSNKHPVLLNQFPWCENHALFLLFAEEGLPQVLSDELLLLLLQIFKLSQNPNLRLGYNSMGGDCIANNLHFHLLSTDKLFKDIPGADGMTMFPIENCEKKLFFKTHLKHKNTEEVDMYNCGVRFGEVVGWPLYTLVLSPDITSTSETSLEDAQEALAHTAGVVINYMIDSNIPHNLLISDEGMTIYIIPRKFDLLIENINFSTSFETLCGYINCKVEMTYKGVKHEEFYKRMSQAVSLKESEF